MVGIAQVLYPGSAYPVLIPGLLALYYRRQDLKNGMGRLLKDIAQVFTPPFTLTGLTWLLFIVFFILLNLSIALTPPISKDALIYHLVGPRIFIQNHGIGFVPGNFYTNFPFTTEMLFAVGMLLKGPILAKLIHFSFGVLTLVAIFQWTAAKASASTGILAGAVYYTLPLVARLSGWAYIDLSLAFYVLLMIMALLHWREFHHKGFLALAGVFGGIAMGTKYSGILMVLIIILGALLFFTKGNRMGTRAVRVFLIAAVVASPWYIKNWILTGNPTYPFLYPLFGGRDWSQEMAKTYAMFLSFVGSGPGLLNYLRLPWDICFVGGGGRPDFDGFIGPIFLLVPILWIAVRPKTVDIKFMLFFSLLYFILCGLLIQQLRFLIPIFPVLSIILALLIYKTPKARRRTRLCILFFCLFTFAVNSYFHLDYLRRIAPHKYLSGIQSEAQFLGSHLPSYMAIEYINHHLTDRDKVLFVFLGNGLYYCKRPYVYDPVFEANTFMDAVKASTSAREALTHLRQKGVTHILINHDYVPSIASILGEKHREKYFNLMGSLSPEACFGNFRLYRANELSWGVKPAIAGGGSA
jgi:4-amino-4-deoxy-L-arabinose transferase-like glycosyltransferase